VSIVVLLRTCLHTNGGDLPLTRVLTIYYPLLTVVVLDVPEGGSIYAWKKSIKSTGKEISL